MSAGDRGLDPQRSRGLAAAIRLAKVAARPPTDTDRPVPSISPGRKRKPLPGQMGIEDVLAETAKEAEEP